MSLKSEHRLKSGASEQVSIQKTREHRIKYRAHTHRESSRQLREWLSSDKIDPMKRMYELMLVLKPDIEPKDAKKIADITKKLLGDASYTVKNTDVMGKKTLAYPINKFTEGLYVRTTIEGENISVGAIETKTKLEPSVLRYLLTKTGGAEV